MKILIVKIEQQEEEDEITVTDLELILNDWDLLTKHFGNVKVEEVGK